MSDVKYSSKDEFSIWHRKRLDNQYYALDVDYLEIRKGPNRSLWWVAVVETKRNFAQNKLSTVSSFQETHLQSLSKALELPYFVIHYKAKIKDVPRVIQRKHWPEQFQVVARNKKAKDILKDKSIESGSWIDEPAFMDFLMTLPLQKRLP